MKISQREARRLRKRVDELEGAEQQRANSYTRDYPGGVHIFSARLSDEQDARLETARRLGHAIVATIYGGETRFYAIRLQAEP